MRGHLIARALTWLGGAAFILLLLSASGILNLLTAGRGGSSESGTPLSSPKCQALHEKYNSNLRIHDASRDLQLVFYGDDWVESWRGTAAGDPCPACDGIRAMWERHFATQWSAAVYGIAGLETGHLLWRLRNGGTPRRQPPVQVLYIGAADLDSAYTGRGEGGAAAAAPGIVSRIEDSLKLLHGRRPTGRVLLLALLPRASPTAPGNASSNADGFPWPTPLAAGILAVNERLEALADRYPAAHYVDCGSALLIQGKVPGQRFIARDLVPDGRQPGLEGMHRIGLCLDSLVHHLITGPPPIGASMEDEDDDPTPERPENLQTRYVEETGKKKKPKRGTTAAAAGPVHPSATFLSQLVPANNSSTAAAAAAEAAVTAGAADTVLQPQLRRRNFRALLPLQRDDVLPDCRQQPPTTSDADLSQPSGQAAALVKDCSNAGSV